MKMEDGKDEKPQGGSRLTAILILIALTAASIVFAVLCIHGANVAFLSRNTVLFSILAGVLLCGAFGVSVWFVHTGKQTLFKTALSVFIFVLFCLLVIFILQKTGFFNVIKDSASLQKYLEHAGAWMPILYIALQYLQVVILPIPSVVSTVAGLALFGSFWTMIYSLIGILLGSLTAFFIGRKLGHKAVVWMVGKDTLEKWQNKLKGKDNLFLTVMFLFPLFPDDVLCFIAGLSSMSSTYFIIMIVVSRILAIGTTCYSLDFIPLNTWWGLLIWGVLIAVFAVVFVLVYKNMDKIHAFLSKRFHFFKKNKK